MKYIIFSLFIALIFFTGCNSKPSLELSATPPYTLKIVDFTWSYGLIEINKFSGDFETLDHKVFNLLEGKQGTCEVILVNSIRDKYGKESIKEMRIGAIDLTELNRYESWEYWHKETGIQRLLSNFLNPPMPMADSAKVVDSSTNSRSINLDTTKAITLTDTASNEISFTTEDLYNDEIDRTRIDSLSHIDSGLYIIRGTICGLHPNKNIIEVKETKTMGTGSYHFIHLIHVYPYKAASTSLTKKLISALKINNKIECVCTGDAGATELLISADIKPSN